MMNKEAKKRRTINNLFQFFCYLKAIERTLSSREELG